MLPGGLLVGVTVNLQPVLKLPFRLARAAVRGVRGVVAPRPPVPPPVVPPMPRPPAPPPAPAAPSVAAAPAPRPPAGPLGVRIEPTPNPDARKFVCSATVVPEGSVIANGPGDAHDRAFVAALFAIEGVRTVFATRDFVTVTREPHGPGWSTLQPAVEAALRATVPG